MACFTRPEFKVERVSYEVITPSAARAIFDAIFWKPAIRWQIERIEVLNPIKWTSVRRNEVGAVASIRQQCIYVEDKRQQKSSLILQDVCYRITARMLFIPPNKRKVAMKHEPDANENPAKYQSIFERRARKGQCFNQPYLGTREFSAYFRLIEDEGDLVRPIEETRDLGVMHYDMDFTKSNKAMPIYFHARMVNGAIDVPPIDSKELMR